MWHVQKKFRRDSYFTSLSTVFSVVPLTFQVMVTSSPTSTFALLMETEMRSSANARPVQ